MTAEADEGGAGAGHRRSVLLTLAAVTILIGAIKLAEPIAVVVLLSAFIATAAWPIAAWLIARSVPRPLAIALTIFCVLALFGSVGLALLAIIGDLPSALTAYSNKFSAIQQHLASWLERRGVDRLAHAIETSSPIDPASLAKGVLGAATFFVSLGAVLIIASFMLLEASSLPDKLRAFRKPGTESHLPTLETLHHVQRYLLIKTITSGSTGVLLGLWTLAWGFDNPLLWGMVAFLLNFLPNVGSFIAATPPVLLALTDMGWPRALGVAGGYVAVNVLVGNVIEPRVMGRTMGLSPLAVLLSIFFWGWVLGPVGALLSVPLTMVGKLLLELHDSSRPLAMLLGPPVRLAQTRRDDGELKERPETEPKPAPPPGAVRGLRHGHAGDGQ